MLRSSSVVTLSVQSLLVAGGVFALTGCGMSNPRLAIVKSPEASPCQEADCPTLEIPAPNHDEQFNPAAAAVVKLDGAPVKQPFVFASKGRIWYAMKINPGQHTVKVEPIEGQNLTGAIVSAARDALKFEAKKGKRYWLFNRIGVGGYSSNTWVEDSAGDRPVVAGERKLEAHNLAASIFLGEGEKKAVASQVEVWWAGAPTYDKIFHGPGVEHVGDGAGAPAK
jgi:hypothetical protein